MKAAATCREEIVRAAIALKQDAGEISMRQIAKACGVAVGTVYHYFPDKTALLIAAVEQVWREIFAPLMKPGLPGDALSLVEAMGGCIREGRRRYPGFFSAHGLAFDDAERGRAAMDEATGHMRAMLAEAFAPHAAEEIWEQAKLGEGMACQQEWPAYDPEKCVDQTVEIAVQINGKVRSRISIAADLDAAGALAAAKADEKIRPALEGKQIVKELYVPKKLVNLVVK